MRKWTSALCATIVLAATFAAGCGGTTAPTTTPGSITDPAAGDPANVAPKTGGGDSTDPTGGAGAGNPAGDAAKEPSEEGGTPN